jgi:hypothetical protein
MKKSELKDKLIAIIRSNFTIQDEDFATDTNNYIQASTDQKWDNHSDFNEQLAGILNKEFPENKQI